MGFADVRLIIFGMVNAVLLAQVIALQLLVNKPSLMEFRGSARVMARTVNQTSMLHSMVLTVLYLCANVTLVTFHSKEIAYGPQIGQIVVKQIVQTAWSSVTNLRLMRQASLCLTTRYPYLDMLLMKLIRWVSSRQPTPMDINGHSRSALMAMETALTFKVY
jgi:hypothetical protein